MYFNQYCINIVLTSYRSFLTLDVDDVDLYFYLSFSVLYWYVISRRLLPPSLKVHWKFCL